MRPKQPRQPKQPKQPKLRRVILDGSFVRALLATDVPEHWRTREIYTELVDNSAVELDRLFALSTVLGAVPKEFRRGALAPVNTLHVSRQHRSAATAMVETRSFETALTLVMMRRERIGVVAAASHDFDRFDVDVLGPHVPRIEIVTVDDVQPVVVPEEPIVPEPAVDTRPQLTAVVKRYSSGTEPPPAPRSTAE